MVSLHDEFRSWDPSERYDSVEGYRFSVSSPLSSKSVYKAYNVVYALHADRGLVGRGGGERRESYEGETKMVVEKSAR